MSGVKNLRAMFEQKGDTSPPSADDRGRSPGVGSTGTESPRPLSKIRNDFIAVVEKDGRLGLQRNTSRDSNVSGVSSRALSGDLETPNLSRTTSHENTTSAPAETKTERSPLRRTSLREQPIPESPRSDSNPQMPSLPLPKSPNVKALAPPINPDKTVDEEEVDAKMALGGPTDKFAVTGVSPAPSSKGETSNGVSKGRESGKDKGKAVAKESAKASTSTTKVAGKTVAPVNTTNKPAAKPTKSPTVTKPLKSPATGAPKLASKTTEKKPTHAEKTTAPKASASTANPTASAAGPSTTAKKPAPLQPSASGTGFVKPKVKSPTRPVKLPPGLTTHTAASATKFNVPRESRQSLPAAATQDTERHGRSHSRASISTTGTRTTTTATAGKNAKRQSSTASRPSIGPPPKQKSNDHPTAKKEAHVDEGFLARMMRPTAASASKTHEKAPTTPPRKTAAAPVKKAVHKPETQHPEIKHAEKKQPEKKQPEPKLPEPKPVERKQQENKKPEPKQPETKQPETKQPDAKHVKTLAKSAQADISSSAAPEQSSPAKKVVPVVEKATTAEEAIAAAKKIDGPAELPRETAAETKKELPKSAEAKQPEPEGKKDESLKEEQSKEEQKKDEPASKEAVQPAEKFEGAAGEIEAAKQAEDDATPAAVPEPAAPKHEIPPEQDEAPVEQEAAAEEAPSEATLVNGATADKAATESELVTVETSNPDKADEGKIAEDLLKGAVAA